ncbi:MAG: c-type cytochrome, partial [Candidatus Brocadiales bacterium]
MEKKGQSYLFIWVFTSIVVVVILLKVLFPLMFKIIYGKPVLVPTPVTLFIWFMIMTVVATAVYVLSSEARLNDFMSFLAPEADSTLRNGLLIGIFVIIPLLAGYITYGAVAPGSTSPVEFRIQHPQLPEAYEHLENPYRKADPETRQQAMLEGKTLFLKNCQPCHGDSGAGDGPMARGLRLKPANFTDPGTIATVVEAFVFWRIKEGYKGLPSSATPWDSAMPVWKNDLTDEEIWKIVTAIYEVSGVAPRQPEVLGEGHGDEGGKFVRLTPSISPTDGKALYEHRCIACHGVDGDGNGPIADYLFPRPRDFTSGLYKFRTTTTGELPLSENISKAITFGMPGTAMPAWHEFGEQERSSLVTYLKAFSEDFEYIPEEEVERVEIEAAPQLDDEALKQGRELYVKMKCIECHGENGKGNGPAVGTHIDDWGQAIFPANLTEGWKFRRGNTITDVFTTFSTGFNGTPMPSYADSLSSEERWALAHYISTLSAKSSSNAIESVVLTSEYTSEELPDNPDDPRWETIIPVEFPMIPQVTIKPRWQNFTVSNLYLKSIYNDTDIAFLMEWNDKTKNVSHRESDAAVWDGGTDSFLKVDFEKLNTLELRDAVAIKFPSKMPEGPQKPHFIMGGSKPINLWQWNADWQEDTGKKSPVVELNAKGLSKPPT